MSLCSRPLSSVTFVQVTWSQTCRTSVLTHDFLVDEYRMVKSQMTNVPTVAGRVESTVRGQMPRSDKLAGFSITPSSLTRHVVLVKIT